MIFLTGLAHITLPASGAEAYILGSSANNLLIAADTTGSGHYTAYPSDEQTAALQVPVVGGSGGLPAYEVLDKDRACGGEKQFV